MSKLSGKALAERAKELKIPGRSKMSADELRAEINRIETANDAPVTPDEVLAAVFPSAFERDHAEDMQDSEHAEAFNTESALIESEEKEEWHTLPNRKESRKRRRNLGRLRNDGTPKGGYPPAGEQSAEAFEASVIAGQQGKFYGRRKDVGTGSRTRPAHRTTAAFPGEPYSDGPRDIPVNVIYEGH